MKRVKISAVWMLAVAAIAGTPLGAQTNPVAVNIQGAILDRSEPPAAPVEVSESVSNGAQVMLSGTSDAGFNLVLFSGNSGQSKLFGAFEFPGRALDVNGVHIPGSALVFYGNLQDGHFAGDLLILSGYVGTTDSLPGPQDILYTGSLDNPAMRDPIEAPMYSWDYASDALVGNGDNLACGPATGPLPKPGYIAVIERGTCSFAVKAQNAAKAGAAGIIVFNHEAGGDTFISNMITPGGSIPAVFVKRSDGQALVKHADDNRSAPATIEIYPTNLLGTINGTYQMNPDGALGGVNLNLVISTQGDYIFSGTITR
jgi:hypothetical protein